MSSLNDSVDDSELLKGNPGSYQVSKALVISIVAVWFFLVVLFPSIFYFGYGADNWQRRSANVANCEACSCMHQDGCWDGRFKGSYPTGGYKSMWFNIDFGMMFIMLDLVIYLALALESFKAIVRAWSFMSWGPLMAYSLCVYPNFYSFWSLFTYFNDRNWNLLDNQLFFCATEIITAWLCVWLMDKRRPHAAQVRARGIVCGISAAHIALALIDQIRGGYFFIAPHSYQRLRDLFLMMPEVVVIAILCRRESFGMVLKCVLILVPCALLLFAVLPLKLFLAYL